MALVDHESSGRVGAGERVAILGASSDRSRYAYRAFELLRAHGHTALPVNPTLDAIDGVPVAHRLADLDAPVDTVTVYMRPALSEPLAEAIIAARPKRVIFNPGAESPRLRARLEAAGIRVQWACTLVLLRDHQYDR
jgi:predicted CoA-binding protein